MGRLSSSSLLPICSRQRCLRFTGTGPSASPRPRQSIMTAAHQPRLVQEALGPVPVKQRHLCRLQIGDNDERRPTGPPSSTPTDLHRPVPPLSLSSPQGTALTRIPPDSCLRPGFDSCLLGIHRGIQENPIRVRALFQISHVTPNFTPRHKSFRPNPISPICLHHPCGCTTEPRRSLCIQQPNSRDHFSCNDRKHGSCVVFCQPLGFRACASPERPDLAR